MAEVFVLDEFEEILLRLDVEDLLRCKSVCKSWYSFISSPYFVKAHLKQKKNNREHGHFRIQLHWSTQLPMMVGSSNGLVCISRVLAEFLVTNPSTREVKEVPAVPYKNRSKLCWGFGYDSSTDDYKVVVGNNQDEHHMRFHVLTLKSNQWKLLGELNYNYYCRHGPGYLYNGALHWFMDDPNNSMNKVILSFDLSLEKFKEIPQPDDTKYVCDYSSSLGIFEECLCIFRATDETYPQTWVMKNNNVKQQQYSWELLPCDYEKNEFVAATPAYIVNCIPGGGNTWRLCDDNKGNFDLSWRCWHNIGAPIFVRSLVSPYLCGKPKKKSLKLDFSYDVMLNNKRKRNSKVLQSTIYEVDLDRILQSIHLYLQELGMEEIRRRAGADDKPLRMVKTVLHELVKLRGTAIKGHLSMVPIDMEPQPIILAYIDLNLQTLAAARMLTPTGPAGQTHWGDSMANNPMAATHSADAQLKQELAAIFKKIGDKQTCSTGLYELYQITRMYPKVDIFSQLQNASEAFRTYIRDGLAQMEKNDAAGRTPSIVPMPTPPPSSLNLSSPRFAPLSPVHTNSLNDGNSFNTRVDPTGISLSPADAENIRSSINAMASRGSIPVQSEDQRNDRFPSGVSSGTLDAIRERMKSIQLASTGNPEPGNRPITHMNGSTEDHHQQPPLPITQDHSPPPSHLSNDEVSSVIDPSVHSGILPMDEKALSGLQARMERLKSGSMDPL